jgi:cytochrome c oxidase assembly factor 2
MPPHPHLHPRSRFTSSLFGTTLLVSFLVVAMPHILPCPAPRVAYADAEGEVNRRRRGRSKNAEGGTEQTDSANRRSEQVMGITDQELARMVTEREETRKKGRECPVPKPGGWVGEWFGWKRGAGREGR